MLEALQVGSRASVLATLALDGHLHVNGGSHYCQDIDSTIFTIETIGRHYVLVVSYACRQDVLGWEEVSGWVAPSTTMPY